ncbi:MAG: hypothetical protein H6636_10695 [Anaerolineales bacterium]|nr:hypothetical protein [Anaerolineales bacterium]
MIFLIPLLFAALACGAQAHPTPDVAGMVNATLTALAQTTQPVTLQPTETPVPTQAPTETQTPTPLPVLSLDSLRNGAYHSPDWGDYTLTDGTYYRPPLNPDEASSAYTTVMLDTVLYGDINADGLEDAIVFLNTQNGGTGHFIEMAAMLNLDGIPSNISAVYLGDRIGIEAGSIQDGLIALNLIVQGPNDPLCCPSQHVTWSYRLENGQLIQVP